MTRLRQIPLDLGHRQTLDRQDFWVSDSNREAVAWLDKWPEWPAPGLVIWGPPASGKTHLAHVWRKESHAKEMTAEDIAAVASGSQHRAVIIDDAEKLIGKQETEQQLFHLYNGLKETGGHLLLTAAKPPKEWNFVLPDLKSRVLSLPAVGVGSPDDQLMSVVLVKLFSDRQIFVPQDVIRFIIPRVGRSFLDLRTIVDKIDDKAMAEKRSVTVPLVRELLQPDLF